MLYGGYIAFCCEKEKGTIVLANNKLIENTFDENVCVIFHELLHIYKEHCSPIIIPPSYAKLKQYLPEIFYNTIASLIDNVSNDYIVNKFLYRIMPDETIGFYEKSFKEFNEMRNKLRNDRMLGDLYIILRLFCLIKSANCIIDDINVRNKNNRYLRSLKQNYFYKVINKRISYRTLSNRNILFTTISEIISDEWRFR